MKTATAGRMGPPLSRALVARPEAEAASSDAGLEIADLFDAHLVPLALAPAAERARVEARCAALGGPLPETITLFPRKP